MVNREGCYYAYERQTLPERAGRPRKNGTIAILDVKTDPLGRIGETGLREFLSLATPPYL